MRAVACSRDLMETTRAAKAEFGRVWNRRWTFAWGSLCDGLALGGPVCLFHVRLEIVRMGVRVGFDIYILSDLGRIPL